MLLPLPPQLPPKHNTLAPPASVIARRLPVHVRTGIDAVIKRVRQNAHQVLDPVAAWSVERAVERELQRAGRRVLVGTASFVAFGWLGEVANVVGQVGCVGFVAITVAGTRRLARGCPGFELTKDVTCETDNLDRQEHNGSRASGTSCSWPSSPPGLLLLQRQRSRRL